MVNIYFQDSGRSVALATNGWQELISEGKHHPVNTRELPKSYSSFIATKGRRHIGIIQFMKDEWAIEKKVYMGICYVLPEYRGKGIFAQLWQKFVEHIKLKGYQKIDIGTHATNQKMQKIIEQSLGGYPEFFCYTVKV